MARTFLEAAPSGRVAAATASIIGVLIMTSIHHAYGAMLFATPWRLHVVYVSFPVGLAILGAIPLARGARSRLARRTAAWVYAALGGLFAIGAIGLYEGGYNHLLPNLQYLAGVEHTLREGLYEPPDDLFFQVSGIAQFVIAAVAAWQLARLLSARDGLPGEARSERG